ncbi:MAG: PQQ-like beta-propeller repeat protein [Chloroflexi bacterium]|nr:PQQ-like beta-propeller repeat protein [Chloroflexota bacterium]
MNRSRKFVLVFLMAGAFGALLLTATTGALGWQSNDVENPPIVANSPQAIVPGWQQSNTSGFGIPSNNTISALEVFNSQMYATTWNDAGAQVWRTSDGKAWSQFTPGSPYTTTVIYDAKAFGNYLYIGTYLDTGGEIWRTNGTTWERVATGGLGDANNITFSAFAVYSNTLYVATGNLTTGVEIWRSTTGNSGSWTQVNTDGFGGGVCWDAITLDTFGGYLYAGIGRAVGGTGSIAELWRTNNGTNWNPVFTNGLGNANNTYLSAMAEYKGHLYIGMRNTVNSGNIYGTTNGTTFNSITTNGFYNPNNTRPYGLYVSGNVLYIVFSNYATGAEVWKTDGSGWWTRVMQGGWGDANNKNADYFDKAAVTFNNSLYIGTGNDVTGGQIWLMLRQLYLPLIMR